MRLNKGDCGNGMGIIRLISSQRQLKKVNVTLIDLAPPPFSYCETGNMENKPVRHKTWHLLYLCVGISLPLLVKGLIEYPLSASAFA